MNIEEFFEKRRARLASEKAFRDLCFQCLQPAFGCYCQDIRRFDPKFDFVILIHPIEVRRRIATGRMSHLCLENSSLIMGQDYSKNETVNSLIKDNTKHSVILYPGSESINLSELSESERQDLFPNDKKLQVFVIDGTWATAGRMIRQSQNLSSLPKISFTPTRPSAFRVRKQPAPECFSTIEAIHQTVELLGLSQGYNINLRHHDNLLAVFNKMVERQLACVSRSKENPRFKNYHRVRRNKDTETL